MGSFARTSADAEVQNFIFGKLKNRPSASVVSVNAIVSDLCAAIPDCALPSSRLIELISEAAMLLGLVPVYDPARPVEAEREFWDVLGYGHRAHRPDPRATYVFRPGRPRTLPLQSKTSGTQQRGGS